MTALQLAMLLILPAIAIPVLLTWLLCVKLVPPGPRKWVRWAYPGLVFATSVPTIGGYITRDVHVGSVVCVACGKSKRTMDCLWVSRDITPPDLDVGVGPTSDDYERAFLRGTPHDHHWMGVGCHWSGCSFPFMNDSSTVSCTRIGPCTWFRDLPDLEDRALAQAYADRVRTTSVHGRRDLLRSYDRVCYDREGTPVSMRFAPWREAWRRDHPDWP